MNSSESNIPTKSEMDELRSENERLKKELANHGLTDCPSSKSLLNSFPVAIWLEDFSEVKKFLDVVSGKGVSDFNRYFLENPEDIEYCASLIRVISANDSALKMTGIDTVPERSNNLPRFFNADYKSIFQDEFVVLANGGTSFRSNAVRVDTNDKSAQIIFQLDVVEGCEHDLSRVLITVTDITKETFLEKERNLSEAKWQTIFGSLVDGIMIIDRDLKITTTNFHSLNRPSANNPIGKLVTDLVVPDEKAQATTFYNDVFNSGKSGRTEHRSRMDDHETIHNIIASPLKIDGEIDQIVVVARNMTGLRKTEQELFLSEARWESIFNYASDLIYIVDRDYVVTEANNPALEVISNKMVGNNIKNVVLPENVEAVTQMITEVFKTEKQLQTTIKIPEGKYKGHLYSCDVSTLPKTGGESSAIIISRDITKSKNLEKQMLGALIHGEERERKRVASDLHDGLGQLFTALNINMQLFKLQNKTALNIEATSQLEGLEKLVEMAISEVKGISKNLVPTSLHYHGLIPALKEVIHPLEGGKTKIYLDAIDVNKRYPEKAELAVFRALQEMLNNAVKYAKAESIHVQLAEHEESIVLTVEDDGIGLNPKDIQNGNGLGNTRAR